VLHCKTSISQSCRCKVVLPYPKFCLLQFQLPMVNCDPKILHEKFQK
jgi:hypothetical protein